MQGISQRPRRRAGRYLPGVPRPLRSQAGHVSLAVCTGCGTEGECGTCAGLGCPQRTESVVRRKDCDALRGQGVNDRAVFFGYCVDRAHEFKVLALGVVHQRHGRLGHGSQRGYFTGVVHAEFDYGHLVFGAQAQQGQRHTDIVVEVALGCQAGLGFEGPQNGGNHLGHCGLAIATRHRDQRQLELRPPSRGQAGQCQFGIRHHQPRQAGGLQALIGVPLANRCHRAPGPGLNQKIIAVKTLTPQRHKQISGLNRPGVGVNALKGHRVAVTQGVHEPHVLQTRQGFLQGHHFKHGTHPVHANGPRRRAIERDPRTVETGQRPPDNPHDPCRRSATHPSAPLRQGHGK